MASCMSAQTSPSGSSGGKAAKRCSAPASAGSRRGASGTGSAPFRCRRALAHASAGQAVHQVEVESLEMLAGQLGGTFGLRGIVNAAEGLQMRIVEALDAERQAIDPGGTETGKFRPRPCRVGFQRDFGIRRQHGQGAEGGEQFVDGGWRQQAGRAAAKIR